MANSIKFVFKYDNAMSQELVCRLDLLTVKGFQYDYDIFEIDVNNLNVSHPNYCYTCDVLKKIIYILEYQNINCFPHMSAEDIIYIYALADYLGLEILINRCRTCIKQNNLIKNKLIFILLLDYPYPQYNYNTAEIRYIIENYINLVKDYNIPNYLNDSIHIQANIIFNQNRYINDLLVKYIESNMTYYDKYYINHYTNN